MIDQKFIKEVTETQGKSFDDLHQKVNEKLAGFKRDLGAPKIFDDAKDSFEKQFLSRIPYWIGENAAMTGAIEFNKSLDEIKCMMYGVKGSHGKNTLGLVEISKRNMANDLRKKQEAGYFAEVLGVAKKNLKEMAKGSSERYVRADDLKDHFKHNDKYVDIVKLNKDGQILERIQSKFVGNSPKAHLDAMISKKFDRYYDHIDKMWGPADFVEVIKSQKMIDREMMNLEKQLAYVKKLGKSEIATQLEKRLESCKKYKRAIDASPATKNEALHGLNDPKEISKKLFSAEGHRVNFKAGLMGAGTAAVFSSFNNIKNALNGKISPEDAIKNIGKDAVIAGIRVEIPIYATRGVAISLGNSSSALFRGLANIGIMAAVTDFAIDSLGTYFDYAQGNINGKKFAYEVGKHMIAAGSRYSGAAVGTKIGAALGTAVVPGVGTVIGAAGGGMVGSAVSSVLASAAYKVAVDYGVPIASQYAERAKSDATELIESVNAKSPQKVEMVRNIFNEFWKENKIPVAV